MQTSRSLWRSENGEWRRGASPTHNSFPSSWQAALCILKALLNGSRPTFNTDMCISKDQKYKIKKLKRKEHTSFGHSLIFFRQSGGRIHAGRGYWKKKSLKICMDREHFDYGFGFGVRFLGSPKEISFKIDLCRN